MSDATGAASRLAAVARLALLGSDGAAVTFSRAGGRWKLKAAGPAGHAQVTFDAPAGWTPGTLTHLIGVRTLGADRLELRFAGPDDVQVVVVSGHRLCGV